MGYRLHVAKLYKVEFASLEEFNWKPLEFWDFLHTMGITPCPDDNIHDYEIYKESWIAGIALLKNFETKDNDFQKEVKQRLEDLETTRDGMIETMQKFLDAADPTNDYLKLSYF